MFKKVLLFLVSFSAFSQDVVVLKHTNYTSHYSTSKHYPIYVEYTLTRDMVGCINPLERIDAFQPDPSAYDATNIITDYRGSGTDRGHMMSYADNRCQGRKIADESFYMSNMAPQYHELNAGDWGLLEYIERKIAIKNTVIKVWVGNIGEKAKIGRVSVPEKCWKVIYIKSTGKWLAYLFNNDKSLPNGIKDNVVSVGLINSLTGITFNP